MEEEDRVARLEKGGEERPGGVLEDDGGGGGGVVDDGDFVDVFGVDEGLDEAPGAEDGRLEGVEIVVVGLAEEKELVAVLGGDDGGGAAAEAAIIYTGDGGVVVGELGKELRWGDVFWFGYCALGGGGAVEGGHQRIAAEVVTWEVA